MQQKKYVKINMTKLIYQKKHIAKQTCKDYES